MDGVLVDSERIANRIMHESLVANGVGMTLEESQRAFVGRKDSWAVTYVRESFGIELPKDFVARLHERTLAAYDTELKAVDGVAAAIDALDAPFCLASSSDPVRIEKSLRLCGLSDRFGTRTFSSVQVKHGKPAPDLFLLAAITMGFAPAYCAVVEDTLVGLAAAKAAGMSAFAYAGAGHTPRGELAATGATVFDRMDELPALLSRSAAGG
ncbi:MAG: HAD-IA family hydrolase [Alphaproteobacteria bacterium]|nr:HAD-IA family hydrolase [Alphaproteobacteria bacterium]